MNARGQRLAVVASIALALAGVAASCSTPADAPPPPPPAPDGGPDAASACQPGELEGDGGACVAPGVPPERCGMGFESDKNGGCTPVLPNQVCAPGTIALPGETSCHSIMDCGTTAWGNLPIDASTVFVDASFVGQSDGSMAAPWTTIQNGILHSKAGVLVAVAAGTYNEDPDLFKSARVWGRCPEMVKVVASGKYPEAFVVHQQVDKAEVGGISISGAAGAITVVNATNVVVDSVWIHDVKGFGIRTPANGAPTSFTMKSSLVEATSGIGVDIEGGTATLEGVVVRGTTANAGQAAAVAALYGQAVRSNLTIRGSIIDDNAGFGVAVEKSDVVLEASLVRGTKGGATFPGIGVSVSHDGNVNVVSTVFDHNTYAAASIRASKLTMDATTVRDTQPDATITFGRGIDVADDPPAKGRRSNVVVTATLVEDNHQLGIFAAGSDLRVESTIVRGTLPDTATSGQGRGIGIEGDPTTAERGNATIAGCLIEKNHEVGIEVSGSDATVTSTLIRGTALSAGNTAGRGMNAQYQVVSGTPQPSQLTVDNCLIDDNFEFGLSVAGSHATVTNTTISGTKSRPDGAFGDDVCVISEKLPATADIGASHFSSKARAGISNFGATVSLSGSVLDCEPIPLDGEVDHGTSFMFEDGGGNVCECGGNVTACAVVTSNLTPPPPSN